MSLDVPDSPGSGTICQSYFELQFRSKDSQRSFTTHGHFVGTQMTGNKTRTNSAHWGQSCKYPAIYILQCCNLIFHVLHFHVIRMKNNFVKNLFSHDQPKMQTCRLRALSWHIELMIHKSTKLTWKRNNNHNHINSIQKDPLKSREHASMTLNSLMKVFMTSSGLGLPRHQT